MNQKRGICRCVFSGITTLLPYVLFVLAAIPLANANQGQVDDWLPQAMDTIKKQEKNLTLSTPEQANVDDLSKQLKEITPIKSQAHACITTSETQLLKVTEDLATLGESTTKEPPEVIKKRGGLASQQKELDTRLASCKLVLLQSQDLIESINKLQQNILAQQLSARTPHIISVLRENIKAPVASGVDVIDFLRAQYELKLLSVEQFISLILLVIIGIICGVISRRILSAQAALINKPKDSVSAFTLAVRTSIAGALPILLPVAIVAVFLSIALPLSPLPFITKSSYMLGIYLGLMFLINVLLYPPPPAQVYLTKPEDLSKRFARQLKVLLTLGLVGLFLLTGEFRDSLSDPVYYLSRSIYCTLLIINLISTLWLVRLFSWSVLSRGPRIVIGLLFFSCLIAELVGYRNLSVFVLRGMLATFIILALTTLVYRLLKDLCDGLDEGRLEWEKNIRERAGLKPGALFPGLILIRVIVFVGLWGGFVFLTLNVWRLDDPWLAIITSYLTEGFQIGSLNITPTLLIGGIVIFALILNFTRYIKNRVLPQALKYTNLDRGAREAVSSLVGYAGVAIAILVALSISGVDMQNIAIVAGALSVGIGFGLQNIVNNFVSGLILLFERPVRRGDWIVTGDTEGYVKDINIRSTRIQTFDRADVIVPNSELITAKVTNWMLQDSFGRITIPIGVGYDSDVNIVHKILLDIANDHPMIMKAHPQVSAPKVLFRSFGDSSLNFELRCFINDIDQRLNVVSELNFAIVDAFRRDGIEIPFPQRVVKIANWQDKSNE